MSICELHTPELRAMLAIALAAQKIGNSHFAGDVREWAKKLLVMAGPKNRLP